MANLPQQGQPLPDVDFTTEGGERVGARDLTTTKTVLYFYPKDDTPGCTKEACAFRDCMDDYAAADVQVYGVSLDPPSHTAGSARSTASTSRSSPTRTAGRPRRSASWARGAKLSASRS